MRKLSRAPSRPPALNAQEARWSDSTWMDIDRKLLHDLRSIDGSAQGAA
jgi:hypothetical protein